MRTNKEQLTALSTEARQELVRGFNQVADLVKTTFGPKGRNIVIQKIIGYPLVTKDGVTVARHIQPSDPQKKIGAGLCREVAVRTNELVGDGTTTSIVLAQAMVKNGMRMIEAGVDPYQLKKGMEKASEIIIREIHKLSIKNIATEKICQIASVAAKNKQVGYLIGEALTKIGRDGIITIRQNQERRTYVDITNGMQLEKGYLSPSFITDQEKMQVELEKPFVLVTDTVLDNPEEIKRVLNWCIWDDRPLLIVVTDINRDVLGVLTSYKKEGKVRVAAVQAPGYAENRQNILNDLAILTGGSLVTPLLGLTMKKLDKSMLGQAEKVTIFRDRTIVLENKNNRQNLEQHIRQLKVLLSQTSDQKEQEILKKRIAGIAGGIATIWVGGDTEIAMKELKDRVEDAIQAVKAAVESGIVPGGGTIFLHTSKVLNQVKAENEDELAGIKLVQQSLAEPMRQISINAGANGDRIVETCMTYSCEIGYDALNKDFGDMVAKGIVDATKVAITVLQNAVGIASLLLTAEGLIAKPEVMLPKPVIW